MRAKIFCRTGRFQGLECQFESDISIGRARDNGLRLDDSSVSGYHARIHYDEDMGRYTLADTNSRNGTLLDGKRLRHSEALEDLHIISIAGKHDLIFLDLTHQDETVMSHSKAASPATHTKAKESSQAKAPPPPPAESKLDNTVIEESIIAPPAPVAPSAPEDGSMTVVEQDIVAPPSVDVASETNTTARDDDSHRTIADSDIADSDFVPTPPVVQPPAASFVIAIGSVEQELPEGEYSIGRIAGNDIVVNESSISRRHATIRVAAESVTIEDAGSKNGVLVDGARISAPTTITVDSRVLLGEVALSLKKKV